MGIFPRDNSAAGGKERCVADGSDRAEGGRGDFRDIFELSVGYGLILLAIWTPRPWQSAFSWVALVWVLLATGISFDGWGRMGLHGRGFLRSLWVVGAALLLAAAVAMGGRLHTLHMPQSPALFLRRYWTYAIWALLQEFLMLDFFLLRLLRLMRGKTAAVIATAALFGLAHVPNPVLMPLALVWGSIACLIFLRHRNLYTLGLAHAILGICIAVTVPGPVDHNMRVGLGYLTYRPQQFSGWRHAHHRNQRPQIVSTEAWVMAEAPTRRW